MIFFILKGSFWGGSSIFLSLRPFFFAVGEGWIWKTDPESSQVLVQDWSFFILGLCFVSETARPSPGFVCPSGMDCFSRSLLFSLPLFMAVQQVTVVWGGRRIAYATIFSCGATWAASFHLQLQGLTIELFACPACSPFYGSTTSNKGDVLHMRLSNCGATWVDQVLYFCVSEQWYGWQCLGVFMRTQMLMHTKFPCTLHFFSCGATWAASFWLQRQGLAKCVLHFCVFDQRYGCQRLGVLMSTRMFMHTKFPCT